MMGPIVGPQIYNFNIFGEKSHIIIPLLWIVFLGPFWFLPSLNDDEWEEDAKPYKFIFESVGKLLLGLIILSGVLGVLLGSGGRL
jgi:hypothetical protein